jgi:hypothetical protein
LFIVVVCFGKKVGGNCFANFASKFVSILGSGLCQQMETNNGTVMEEDW